MDERKLRERHVEPGALNPRGKKLLKPQENTMRTIKLLE